jgi:hypothetical protein
MGRIVSWLLLLVGVLVTARGGVRMWQIQHVPTWTAETALQHLQDAEPRVVTIAAHVDKGSPRYDQERNDVREAQPQLGRTSPRTGITILGPQAAPKQTWPKLAGKAVRAYIALAVANNSDSDSALFPHHTDEVHLTSRHRILPQSVGGGAIPGGTERWPEYKGRRILVDLGDDLWLLSRPHLVIGNCAETSTLFWTEDDWVKQSFHYGLLRPLKDLSEIQEIAGSLSEKELAAGWIIEDEEDGVKLQFTQYAGYHAYVPVAGGNGKMWAQIPLENDTDNEWHKLEGSSLTGLWLPVGTQHFACDDSRVGEGKSAVLQVSPWVVDRFVGDELNVPFGSIQCLFGGIALLVVAGIALSATARGASKPPSPEPTTTAGG